MPLASIDRRSFLRLAGATVGAGLLAVSSPLGSAQAAGLSATAVRGSDPAAGTPRFSIDLQFSDGFVERYREAFAIAKQRWLNVVVGGVPPITVAGETIDGLLVVAASAPLEREFGLGGLAELDRRFLRPADAGRAAHLPARATLTLDTERLDALDLGDEATNHWFLVDLVTHEMGHALGFTRQVWDHKGLLARDAATGAPLFVGAAAQAVYSRLRGWPLTAVPLEAFGKTDQFISHWRQATFHSEVMTFLLENRANPIGPVTVAAMSDLGYDVNQHGAETGLLDLADPATAESALGDRSDGPIRTMHPLACCPTLRAL